MSKRTARTGYYSEKNKRECYLKLIADVSELRKMHLKIYLHLKKGPDTIQEMAIKLGHKESSICGRLGQMKEAELIRDSKITVYNIETHQPNTLWEIDPEWGKKPLELFKNTA